MKLMPLCPVFLSQQLFRVTLLTSVWQADEGIHIRFSDMYVIYKVNQYIVLITFMFTK